MEIITCDHIIVIEDDEYMSSYASSDVSLDTEVVPSDRYESVISMLQRLQGAGIMLVDRSIVKLGREIGRGGQGTVYEASVSWPYMDKATKMAVKKFNTILGISQGQYPLKLLSEDHFHVLRPRAFFLDKDASLCMIMPLFYGDLRNIIDTEKTKKSGPPFEEVVSFGIITQLAMGMAGLHSVGVCHRDLKAANILVNTPIPLHDALVAEADLTIMHMHMCHIADFESSGDVKGTAFWRSPEVLMSIRTDIPLTDQQWQAADAYSFGMMCYEIVTGEIPFEGKRYSDYDIVINGGRPELPDYVPELLRRIIMDCWDPDPECRPDFDEILKALMLKAQKDPLLGEMTTAWEMMQGSIKSKSESIESELVQLREIVWREYIFNSDALVGHRNHASWGLKYVDYAEQFIKLLRKEEDVDGMMTFVDYVECQKLRVLMGNSAIAFINSLVAVIDMEQANYDIKKGYAPFIEGKMKMLFLGRNIGEHLFEYVHMIGLNNDDNSLTLEEKFKIVDDLVTHVKAELDEKATLELIDHILAEMDPSGNHDEIAIFERHVKFMVRCSTFTKKYNTFHVFQIIMLYFIYTSPYWNHILFQIFGVVLSDSYEFSLGFLCPLLGSIVFNWLLFRFSKYRYSFIALFLSFCLYIYYSLIRSYGFKRQFAWLGIWISFSNGFLFSYAMILMLHEYIYVKLIRMRASFFTHRIKRKEE